MTPDKGSMANLKLPKGVKVIKLTDEQRRKLCTHGALLPPLDRGELQ